MIDFQRASYSTLLGMLLAALLVFTGCDDDSLTPPPVEDDLFARYVSLGNSITAGFQSNGISKATQEDAYPVMLAEKMGTPFDIPSLAGNGCPPPIIDPITGERTGDVECALRETPLPTRLNNVAVPGSAVIDLTNNFDAASNINELTQFFLGGRTQVEAALAAEPTFVSIWSGNNDVLPTALSGIVTDDNLTSTADFEARYTEALDALEDGGVEGGILYGVADVTLIPHFSAGAAYAQAEGQINAFGDSQSPAWGSFTVDASCEAGAQGTTTLVPANYALLELLPAALEGDDVTLNCADDERVLDGGEITLLEERVTAFNDFIQAEAQDRGWAYGPTNEVLQQLRDEGDIPPFPDVSDPANFFGPAFSLDGVHPSSSTHEVIATVSAEAIDEVYGTTLSSSN